ncbi:MAG: VOC family protein [Paracoccaceae bacterium]
MSLRFGYAILYVPDVPATMDHYEAAFGLRPKFLHDSGTYGELETGTTTLAFAAEDLAELHGLTLRPNRRADLAAGFEIALVSPDPDAAYARAAAQGATALSPPKDMPWGQRVAYLRDINGCLVEICSEILP